MFEENAQHGNRHMACQNRSRFGLELQENGAYNVLAMVCPLVSVPASTFMSIFSQRLCHFCVII